jgi:hypothetical protein
VTNSPPALTEHDDRWILPLEISLLPRSRSTSRSG